MLIALNLVIILISIIQSVLIHVATLKKDPANRILLELSRYLMVAPVYIAFTLIWSFSLKGDLAVLCFSAIIFFYSSVYLVFKLSRKEITPLINAFCAIVMIVDGIVLM